MDATLSLETTAELAIAIAGFSGLLAAFRTRRITEWHARERLAFWMIVSYSFAALFFSMLPSLLRDFGASDAVLWRVASVVLALYLAVNVGAALRRSQRLSRQGSKPPSVLSWGLVVALAAIAICAQAVNAVAVVGAPLYRTGVLICIMQACIPFVLFITHPLSEGRSPGSTRAP